MPTSTKVQKRERKGPIQLPTREEAKNLRRKHRPTRPRKETKHKHGNRTRTQHKGKQEHAQPYSTRGLPSQRGVKTPTEPEKVEKRVAQISGSPPSHSLYYREGKYLRPLIEVDQAPSIAERAPHAKPAVKYINRICQEADLSANTTYMVKQVLESQIRQRTSDWLEEGGFIVLPAESRYVRDGSTLYRVGFETTQNLPKGAKQLTSGRTERHGYKANEHTAGANTNAAEDAGIIIKREHNAAKGRASSFRVSHGIESTFAKKTADYMDCYPTSSTRYNLFDIEQRIDISRTPRRDVRTDDSEKGFPDLVLAGMDAVQPRRFNWKAVQTAISGLYDKKESMERYVLSETPRVGKLLVEHGVLGEASSSGGCLYFVRKAVQQEYGEGSDEWQVLRQFEQVHGRWTSALFSFESVKGQSPEKTGDGLLWRYEAAHEPTSTGRITERGGGFQNAPSELMIASFKGIANVYDNDIVSAHDTFLQYEFALHGIDDSGYFERFRSHPAPKQAGANYVGVSRKTFKRMHHALKQQATARGPFRLRGKKITPDIWGYLRDEPDTDAPPKVMLERFRHLTKPLRSALTEWRRKLECHAWETAHRNQHGTYFGNAVGMRFPLHKHQHSESDEEKLTAEGRRKLAAHVLQGMEARFIHTLASILKGVEGVRVVANMHDGLITIGKVPPEAVEEARRATGYRTVELESAPLT